MNLPDFATVSWAIILSLIFFLIIIGRYFLIAGLFYLLFYIWYPKKWAHRKISNKKYRPGQFKKEIKWSTLSAGIFSVSGTITVILWQKGFTYIYTEAGSYGWWYLPVSLLLIMFLQETYYYWMHRWMHKPSVFKRIHRVHHESNIPSPFTAFSFHPLEALLQAIFLPIIFMIVPVHYWVIIVLLSIMSITSVINHLDIEIYSEKPQSLFNKWIIGSTHHSLHHKHYKYNYGLYFTFWDVLKNTQNPSFYSRFKGFAENKTHKKPDLKVK